MRFPSERLRAWVQTGPLRGWRLAVVAVVLVALLWPAYQLLHPYQGFADYVSIIIVQGMSKRAISARLEAEGVLSYRLPFLLYAYLQPHRTLKAGEYRFDQAISPVGVFAKLERGEVHLHALTIPEGFSMFETAIAAEALQLASREAFLEAAKDTSLIADLAPEAETLEGYLFPDTYHFARPAGPRQMVQAMVNRFREVWTSLARTVRPGPNPYQVKLSPHQLVTLASLVEKETNDPAERGLISSVFYNRLKRKLALQCDPTVIYAARLAGVYDGVINVSDLERDSPYNTYLHVGLPPGPIANPGRTSLEAVLNPPISRYLYFVSNTEGGHFFARTGAEHARNVARYRRLRANKEKAARNRR